MSEKRFERWNDHSCKVKDNQEDTLLNWEDVVDLLNDKRYKCPRCKSILVYHHEDKETVTFECKNCNHFVLARKW